MTGEMVVGIAVMSMVICLALMVVGLAAALASIEKLMKEERLREIARTDKQAARVQSWQSQAESDARELRREVQKGQSEVGQMLQKIAQTRKSAENAVEAKRRGGGRRFTRVMRPADTAALGMMGSAGKDGEGKSED